jgi:alpha-glucosidase
MDWWRDAVLYQIYPRSFADTNGDGVGDLRGITEHLDYVARLGVDGVWLSPIHPSPNADWGYDVADYEGVHPELGTLEDLDALLAEADRLGLRVLLDLVPNHTSTAHPWFVDSRSGRHAEHRDWYVWADPKPDGGAPNNWESSFLGPAWLYDEATGQSYLHHFLDEQADLNWWSSDVRDEFDRILRFWFDRGVAGFRIDVCHMIVKDRLLRDNPPATGEEHWMDRLGGQRSEYNARRPEVHDVLRRWRRLGDTYDPPRVFVGETNIFDLAAVASFYGADDELQLAFNFPFLFAPFEADALRGVVEEVEATLPPRATPCWTMSNHDVSRYVTRWCENDPHRARAALVLLLSLRGTAVLYYGDELAMPDTEVPPEELLDPVSRKFHPLLNRDAARTPMPWQAGAGAGFTEPTVTPWLPFGDLAAGSVVDEEADAGSALQLTRALLGLRRELADYREGAYATVAAPAGVWAWARGERVLVAVHLADGDATLPDVVGRIRVGTARDRDGSRVDGTLRLGPWEAVVIERG